MTQSYGKSPLKMRWLGASEVLVGGRFLPPLRYRKDLWLLAYLTLHRDRALPRQEVAALFWPDAGESQALYSLRRSLTNLRRALGPEAGRLLAPSPSTVRLDLTDADCDLLAFEAALARATGTSEPAEMLQQAVRLYGGPLLPDCREEWVHAERSLREQSYLSALGRLARIAQEQGQPAAAVGWLRLLLTTDPFSEGACRDLMQALAVSGDRAAVTRVYRDLVLRLRTHLSTTPAPETDALYKRLSEAPSHPEPPPKAVPALAPPSRRHLPVPLTDLLGRESAVAEVGVGLERSRLVTLSGPGGVGKTRLAIAAADATLPRFEGGVWFVGLAALTDPAYVAETTAKTLGAPQQVGQTACEGLIAFLAGRSTLLVLDNCEHLLDSCAMLVDRLLSACPGLRILSTSRQALGITGEQVYQVPSLALPPSAAFDENPARASSLSTEKNPAFLQEYAGIELFVQRAVQANPTFRLDRRNAATVCQICFHLDGIPLAIELAAVRLRSLSVGDIASRLSDRFRLLTGGSRTALPRQRTLRSLIDWSYDLLNEAEKTLFCRLSVFAGGWTLEAAEVVCAGGVVEAGDVLDLLTSLCDKSLAVPEPAGTSTRYQFLETVRQYSRDRLLESGDVEAVRGRHRDYFVALAEEAEPHLTGPEQIGWLNRLEAEHDNLRAVLDACAAPDINSDAKTKTANGEEASAELSLRLAGALAWFWYTRGYLNEGRERGTRALEVAPERRGKGQEQERKRFRAKALSGVGSIARSQGDFVSARRLFEESLALRRDLHDTAGVAISLMNLGILAKSQGDYVSARSLYEEGLTLHRELGNKLGIANTLGNLGLVAYHQGDAVSAWRLSEESLAVHRELANKQGISSSLFNLALVAFQQRDYVSARSLSEECLALDRELGDKSGVANSLMSLGLVAFRQGDYVSARLLYEECLALQRELGDQQGTANTLGNLGMVALYQEDFVSARTLLEECLAIFRALGSRQAIAECLEGLASVCLGEEAVRQAVVLLGAADGLRESIGAPLSPTEREERDTKLAAARSALGEATFDAAHQEGRAMRWEQAVELAIRESKCPRDSLAP